MGARSLPRRLLTLVSPRPVLALRASCTPGSASAGHFPPWSPNGAEKAGLAVGNHLQGLPSRKAHRPSWLRSAPSDTEVAYRGSGQRGARKCDPLPLKSPPPRAVGTAAGRASWRRAFGSFPAPKLLPRLPSLHPARRHSPRPRPGGDAAAAAPFNWQLSAVRNNTSSLCAASHWLPRHATLPRSSNRRGPLER